MEKKRPPAPRARAADQACCGGAVIGDDGEEVPITEAMIRGALEELQAQWEHGQAERRHRDHERPRAGPGHYTGRYNGAARDRLRGAPVRSLLTALGPLRTTLLALVILSMASAPLAGGEVTYTFPGVLPTLVAPPLAVMLAFVVPLDILMSAIFMADKDREERRRYRLIIAVEVAAVAGLVALWAPFFLRLAG